MKNLALVKRYTQGLINTLSDQGEFAAAEKFLRDFRSLLDSEAELQHFICSPFLPVSKRLQLCRDVFQSAMGIKDFEKEGKAGPEIKAARFILLLVDKDRLALLPDILEYLPIHWNEEQGIVTFEVASVVPLTESQKKKLEEELARLEKRPVSLDYRIDPLLIGGISLRKGNVVIDISIEGNLSRLKEKIVEG